MKRNFNLILFVFIYSFLILFMFSCTQNDLDSVNSQNNSDIDNAILDNSNNLTNTKDSQNASKNSECQTNDGCAVGGCSRHICTTKDKASRLITTCEFKPEYGCYQKAVCGCVNGKCQFIENDELNQCLALAKSSDTGIVNVVY